ncbi:hypothetical protein ACFMQL_12685 [Nonomuraea fastidiosa]|uniref:hypothetical protein n=1 Tax=Nonomuraea TaxID=83681 RepID=UPI0034134902
MTNPSLLVTDVLARPSSPFAGDLGRHAAGTPVPTSAGTPSPTSAGTPSPTSAGTPSPPSADTREHAFPILADTREHAFARVRRHLAGG